jgi:hypothetical protein
MRIEFQRRERKARRGKHGLIIISYFLSSLSLIIHLRVPPKTVFQLAEGTQAAWASSTRRVRPASKNFLFCFRAQVIVMATFHLLMKRIVFRGALYISSKNTLLRNQRSFQRPSAVSQIFFSISLLWHLRHTASFSYLAMVKEFLRNP